MSGGVCTRDYNFSKLMKHLDQQNAEQPVHALVHSHINYCNALLTELPKYVIEKLQMVQHPEARVLCRVGKNEHTTLTIK